MLLQLVPVKFSLKEEINFHYLVTGLLKGSIKIRDTRL